MLKVLYVGCGNNVIDGAVNIDNSFSVKLAHNRLLLSILSFLGFISERNKHFIRIAREKGIQYGEATDLKCKDESFDVVFTSHMMEHLYAEDLDKFIAESWRVLKPGGMLRIAIPDLRLRIQWYEEDHDADLFCERLTMGSPHKM